MRSGEPDPDVLAELTGRSPLRKLPAADPVLGLTRPAARPVAAPLAPAPAVAPEPSPASAEPAPERKKKIGGWNGYPSNLERIWAAQWHTQTQPDGWPSLSEMTEQLLLREAERLEAEHNGGQKFPVVPEGRVKHRRRAGE